MVYEAPSDLTLTASSAACLFVWPFVFCLFWGVIFSHEILVLAVSFLKKLACV